MHGNDIGHGGGGGLPPNILWVMTDQLRRDCVGAYGSRGGRTPHLDSLAEDGVVFDRFYSTCPLCIPARSSLHTGRYPHSCGSLINGFGPVQDKSASVLNEGEVTVDEVLAEGGYHLGHVGVDHVRTEPPERRRGGFAEFISRKEHGAYLEERGLEQPSMWDHQKACPTRIADEVHEIRFSAPNPGRHPFEAEDYFDCYCAREGARFIREAPEDRPFALFLFLWMPHPPFVIPEPYYSMYSPGDVDPPPTLMAEQTGKPPMHLEHLPGQVGADPTREEWLESWAAYLGCVALADDCVGTALGALEETGRSDDTLIVFHPDHGEMLGEFSYFQKMLCYESSIRLPLIISPPGGASGLRGQLCSHIDIMPTLLDYAGLAAPEQVQGTSLRPTIDDPRAPGPAEVFSEYSGNAALDVYQRAVMTERHKYIWNMGGFEELYDLEQDPWETTNLAGREGCAAIEAELRMRLEAWMGDTGDVIRLEA